MYSAWSFSEWIQSLMSACFMFGVVTGVSFVIAKAVAQQLRDDAAPLLPFPAARKDSPGYFQKAA